MSGATVSFGGTAASGVSFVSSTGLKATTPAHGAGTVSVAVTNPDGGSADLGPPTLNRKYWHRVERSRHEVKQPSKMFGMASMPSFLSINPRLRIHTRDFAGPFLGVRSSYFLENLIP